MKDFKKWLGIIFFVASQIGCGAAQDPAASATALSVTYQDSVARSERGADGTIHVSLLSPDGTVQLLTLSWPAGSERVSWGVGRERAQLAVSGVRDPGLRQAGDLAHDLWTHQAAADAASPQDSQCGDGWCHGDASNPHCPAAACCYPCGGGHGLLLD